MRVLHVGSEVAPFSKTGGLGDVLGALPAALGRLGVESIVVSPRYRAIDPGRFGLARLPERLDVVLGSERFEVGIFEGRLPGRKVPVFFIDHPESFDRDGFYGTAAGDFPDNARRFALLGQAALRLAERLGFWPDILHGHDWQGGAALIYARRPPAGRPPPKTVFTIHNLAYQGIFPASLVAELGFGGDLLTPDGIEFWGQVSLLKAGVVLGDAITTVSPRYAAEIQETAHGMGFDGLLRHRRDHLVGILNGADYRVWDPRRDPLLPAHYSARSFVGKWRCKAALGREIGLPVAARLPLFASVSRLVEQKGIDLVVRVLPGLLERENFQYVILGAGQPDLERALAELAAQYPDRVSVRIAYDEGLAHRIEAGADFFVMPSRFEPCGLNQIYSLRYGTLPIVHATGGLDDTVVDHKPPAQLGTGFKFWRFEEKALAEAWRRALAAYGEPSFRRLRRRAMAADFSWDAAARRYLRLYQGVFGGA